MNKKGLLFNNIFKTMFNDTVSIKYLDNEEELYGFGEPKFKIFIKSKLNLKNIIKNPSVTLGEAYMDGKIEILGNLRELIESIYNSKESFLNKKQKSFKKIRYSFTQLKRAKKNIEFHYDIGNEFYKLWLDKTMLYSCAYFKKPNDTLEEAQNNKIEYVLKKLLLEKGQTLLDIGSGWGALIIKAAKKYKVKALGITLSKEQYLETKKRIAEEHLEDLADVRLMDYRELKNEKFDRIVSIGMLEHVGKNQINSYFKKVYELLNEKSLSLVHAITDINDGGTDAWINKYIFPEGYIPGIKEIINSIAKNNFMIKDVESLRQHYAKTLEYWAKNFETSIEEIKKIKNEKFIRMWRLYLNSCSASFNVGNIDIHQILFSKGPINSLTWTRDYMYKD